MLRLGKWAKVGVYVFLIIYVVIIITPFLTIFNNSFKSLREIFLKPFALPEKLSLANYMEAWKSANLLTGYFNSLFISLISVMGILAISSMLSYLISRYKFPFRRTLYLFIIIGLALPARLAVIPIYVTLNKLNLLDTRTGLILVYMATGISFATFLMKRFMDEIPIEIEESAMMDGATPWTIYRTIALPLTRPAMLVVGLVNFVGIWNDFFFPLIIINSRSKETVPLAISVFFGEYSNSWHLISAALSLSVLPIMIIFFLLSKYFIAGMTEGAIK